MAGKNRLFGSEGFPSAASAEQLLERALGECLGPKEREVIGLLAEIEENGSDNITNALGRICMETGRPESSVRYSVNKLARLGLIEAGSSGSFGKMVSVHPLAKGMFNLKGGGENEVDKRNRDRSAALAGPHEMNGAGAKNSGDRGETPCLKTVEIILTNACNLRCGHCYASSGKRKVGELSLEETGGLLRQLKEDGVENVVFTGGEPFLKEGFPEILKEAGKLGLKITINTNGTLISRKIARQMKELDIDFVQVSVDGMEETHDLLRGVKGAFRKTVKGIKCLGKEGIPVEITTVFQKNNSKELKSILEFAKKAGAKKFSVDCFVPSGRAESQGTELPKKEYVEAIAGITDMQKIKKGNGLPRCGFGFRKAVVDANGNILLCPVLSDVIAGNTRKGRVKKVFEESQIFRQIRNDLAESECMACPELEKCCMGCRARAFVLGGSFKKADEMHCALFGKNNGIQVPINPQAQNCDRMQKHHY